MDVILNKSFLEHEEYRPFYHTKYIGKSGRIWIVGLCPSAGDFIHVSPNPRENERRFTGFRGYGGSTLKFTLQDGTIESLTGPWHSNSDALFQDTGIDFRDKHATYIIISKKRIQNEKYQTVMVDVIHQDYSPVIGLFERGTLLAMEMAKTLNQMIFCYSESLGGSSCCPIYPDQIDIHGRRESDADKRTNVNKNW